MSSAPGSREGQGSPSSGRASSAAAAPARKSISERAYSRVANYSVKQGIATHVPDLHMCQMGSAQEKHTVGCLLISLTSAVHSKSPVSHNIAMRRRHKLVLTVVWCAVSRISFGMMHSHRSCNCSPMYTGSRLLHWSSIRRRKMTCPYCSVRLTAWQHMARLNSVVARTAASA